MEEAKKRGEKGAEDLKEFEAELAETKKKNGQLYNEVMGKLEFFHKTAAGRGGIGLIWAELNAFKHAQITFFNESAVVLKAHEGNKENDPVAGWKHFEGAMNEAVRVRATRLSLQYQSSNTVPTTPVDGEEQAKEGGENKAEAVPEDSKVAGKQKPPMPPARQISLVAAKALYDYEATNEGDLALTNGDIISVTEQNDNGWWKGRNNRTGESGYFPGNYCELLDDGAQDVADADV